MAVVSLSPEEKSMTEEPVVPEKPEVVVFAMFGSTAKYPVKISMLGEMVCACIFHFFFFGVHRGGVRGRTCGGTAAFRLHGFPHWSSFLVTVASLHVKTVTVLVSRVSNMRLAYTLMRYVNEWQKNRQ